MPELFEFLHAAASMMSPWEAVAAVLAVGYLWLAIRQNVACWPVAIASAAIYLVLMFQAGLVMQSGLQAFYIAMAIYGWLNWKRPSGARPLQVTSWSARQHLGAVGLILGLGLLSGALLSGNDTAAMPYLDSLVAWGAIVTTWMVARKILQNWIYWFVIDSLSIYLYSSQGLWLTAGLFLVYLVMVVVGYRLWRNSMDSGNG